MRIMRRYILAAFVILLLATSFKLSYAEDRYPLEDGEKLVEERIIDEAHTEIFTQLQGEYYIRKLERNNGQWTIIASEIIRPKWTGLQESASQKRGDRELAKSIETELRRYGLASASLPPVVDFSDSPYLPPVGEQWENSCVGWSTGYYLRTFQQAKDIGWDVKHSGIAINSHVFSPNFIYNQINGGQDNGTSLLAAAQLLQSMGDATLEKFPYIPGDFLTKPNTDVVRSAYPHRVRDWRLLYSEIDTDDYIVSTTKQYLNTGDLVVAGSRVGWNFVYPYIDSIGNSIITNDNSYTGNHAYVIVGYDDNFVSFDGVGAFKLINSWGRGWGDDGYSYISYKAFTNYAMEGYVFTDLVNVTEEQLQLEVNDDVTFHMNFSGSGRFDIKIKGENNEVVYEENDLQGKQGLNMLTWNGKDRKGNMAKDGSYQFSIIPYYNSTPKASFDIPFYKSGKVEHASGSAFKYENVIEYVDISLTLKSDGKLSIKVIYNQTEYDIVSDEAVKAGQYKVFRIKKKDFDFNGKNLDQLRFVIGVR